jgi:hypothetical protein
MDRLPFIVALKYDGNRFSIADCLRTGKKPKGKTSHISGQPQAYFGEIKLYIFAEQYSKLTIRSFTLKIQPNGVCYQYKYWTRIRSVSGSQCRTGNTHRENINMKMNIVALGFAALTISVVSGCSTGTVKGELKLNPGGSILATPAGIDATSSRIDMDVEAKIKTVGSVNGAPNASGEVKFKDKGRNLKFEGKVVYGAAGEITVGAASNAVNAITGSATVSSAQLSAQHVVNTDKLRGAIFLGTLGDDDENETDSEDNHDNDLFESGVFFTTIVDFPTVNLTGLFSNDSLYVNKFVTFGALNNAVLSGPGTPAGYLAGGFSKGDKLRWKLSSN